MNCKTAQSIMQEYLDRSLVILDRNEFVRHVSDCRSCEEELATYREVYSFLGDMAPMEAPRGFQNTVVSRLKADGLVYTPKVSAVRRGFNAFLGLPGAAKYPLAAGAVVAALYFPLLLILGQAKSLTVSATVFFTNALLFARDTLGDVAFLARLSDAASSYAKAGKTLLGVYHTVMSSAGENAWLVGIGILAALTAIVALSRLKKKRSSDHAPFSI